MSRFSLELEGQEQDLEIDMAIDAVDERNAQAGDSLADTPFSPVASRAFSTAVDDTSTLSKMNDVLENNDIEDIPESSRQVIQTAMESIRARLLGGSSAKGVAVEGFSNKNDLKIAIEDNKNILQRAWDAIVKFFRSIYEWFVGFFKKKETDSKKIEEKANNIEKAANDLSKVNLNDPEKAKTVISEVKKNVELSGVKVSLVDGTPIGRVNSNSGLGQEDFSNNAKDRNRIAENIRNGKEPIVLTASRYNALFGDENIDVKDLFDFGRSINGQIMDFVSFRHKSKIADLARNFDSKNIDRIPDITVAELADPIMKNGSIEIGAVKISIDGNNSSVQKPDSKEIDITLTMGLINANFRRSDLIHNKVIMSNANEAKDDFYKILDSIDKLNKEVTDDNQELVDLVNKLKTKISLINGLMKASTLVFHYGLQSSKLLLDLTESYIAAVALICEQTLKTVSD